VELLDLYPTLVEWAGLPPVSGLDGVSLRPMLEDPEARVRERALSARRVVPSDVAVSIRSGKWRYTQWPDGSEELHDLDKDPRQLENLAQAPEHAGVRAELHAQSQDAGS
jgi:arylsulfatase A-like enzyme